MSAATLAADSYGITIAQVTGLVAVGGARQVALTWSVTAGATDYSVERSLDGVTSWSVVGTPSSPSFTNTGLAASTTYYYRVRGTHGVTFGPYSTNANATTNFDPSAIAGLTVWLPSTGTLWQDSARTTPATDGNPVGSWDDFFTAGNHFIQATSGQRPTFHVNVQNALPVVRFVHVSSQVLQIASTLGMSNSTFSLYAVCQVDNAAANRSAISVGQDNAPSGGYALGQHASEVSVLDNGVAWHGSGTVPTTSWCLLEAIFSGGSLTIYRNGSLLSTTATTFSSPATSCLVGSDGNAGGQDFWGGDIGEVLAYSVANGTSDRQAIETYLNAKWALY